jgi:hypothetical protein
MMFVAMHASGFGTKQTWLKDGVMSAYDPERMFLWRMQFRADDLPNDAFSPNILASSRKSFRFATFVLLRRRYC